MMMRRRTIIATMRRSGQWARLSSNEASKEEARSGGTAGGWDIPPNVAKSTIIPSFVFLTVSLVAIFKLESSFKFWVSSPPNSAAEKESSRKAALGGESVAKGVAKGPQDSVGRPNGWLSFLFWEQPKKGSNEAAGRDK